MRIAIDINGIAGRSSGLATYLRQLVAHLAAIDRRNEYLLYQHHWHGMGRRETEVFLPRQPNFRLLSHRLPSVACLFAEHALGIRLTEFLLARHGVDVYHGPSNVTPRLRSIRSVLTIHHYLPVSHPTFEQEERSWRERFYFSVTEKAALSAGRIITVSEKTRSDLIEQLDVPPERIRVIYPGGPHPLYRDIPDRPLPHVLASRLPGKFIVFAGPLSRRKNLPMLLEAFASVQGLLQGCQIAITGEIPPSFREVISRLAARLGLAETLVFLGEVADAEMALLYRRAVCLAYLSLFEGFGTPPLEAMACGCPVIASTAGAIPEVAGEAALLVDPFRREAIAQALVEISGDTALRAVLVAKGLERVKRFSWEKMAEEMLQVYTGVT